MKKRKLLLPFVVLFFLCSATSTSHCQVANTISPVDKVYGLSKFWQEVNYNFVYLDKIGRATCDSAYKALLPQVQATTNDYDYYRLLQKFCALLKDGHTEINMPQIKGVSLMSNIFGDYLLVVTRIDGKAIIKRTFKKDIAKFPPGSEIITVNGLPTNQFIRDSIAPYVSSSTDYVREDIATSMLLRGFPGSNFSITIKKPNGEQASYSLTHARPIDSVFSSPPGAFLDEKNRDMLEYKTFDNNIAYVALNSFGNRKIDTLFENLLPSLEKARGIIIDLRYNGGGDDGVAFTILNHFIKDTILTGAATTTRKLDPYQLAVGRYVKVADTAGDSYKKDAWLLYNGYAVYNEPHILRFDIEKGIKKITAPVVILTGMNTESAAEDFVTGAYNQKHIVRIGGPTNGSTGQPYAFDMPGGGSARICVKKDMFVDGREFVGVGIQPDIKVIPTVRDYLENKDSVLEAALKYFKEGKR